jgi:ElaB/YqjD/DUF883 family membrane-anchored ribosome-binding protein
MLDGTTAMKNRIFELLTKPREKPGEAADSVASDAQTLVQRLGELGESVTEHVRRAPAASLGIALACGIAVGWLLKRR